MWVAFFFFEVGNVILLECPLVLFRIYGYFLIKKLRILNKESLLNSSIDEYLIIFLIIWDTTILKFYLIKFVVSLTSL